MNSLLFSYMPDETPKKPNSKFGKHIIKALMLVLIVISIGFISAFLAMNYFGEHFIKKFLQAKIQEVSQGVYEIDFDEFNFNLLSGKTTITGFKLIPNEERYEELRKLGVSESPFPNRLDPVRENPTSSAARK